MPFGPPDPIPEGGERAQPEGGPEDLLGGGGERLAWFARFPEENPGPVLRIAANGRLLYANPAARAHLRSLPPLGGQLPPPLVGPALAALARGADVIEEVGTGGHTFLMRWSPVAGDVNVYGQEITERKLAERALRESEERLRLFVEHAPAAVAMLDRQMRYVVVSRRWLSDYRLGSRDVLGRCHYDIFPELPERWRVIHRRCLAGAVEMCDEDPFPRADGTLDWVRWEIHPWHTADGEIGGIILFSEVVTDRRRAADALRESEARSQQSRDRAQRLVAISAGLVSETSPDGLSHRVAAAARELIPTRYAVVTESRRGEPLRVVAVSGSPTRALVFEHPAAVAELVLGLFEGRDTLRVGGAGLADRHGWTAPPEGHPPLRGLLGARLVARDGQTVGLLLLTDPEAGEFTAEDEALVHQLAVIASLAAQHIEARLRLEEGDRNKNQFLAMLSHELRNPLAPIRNSLHVLGRAAPGSDQARTSRAIIERQVDHLAHLVDDLLDLTRISRGKIVLLREALDLRELLARAVDDHRAAFIAGGTELAAALGDAPVPVRADPTRLAQAIGNLLANAAKFTPRGGRTAVTLERDAATREAVVRVRDTGVGIPEEVLPHVFEPFVQAESTLDRSRGGLGIGLALVKTLMEMHGGSVTARSEGHDRGAEFTVRLPLGQPPVASPAAAPAAASSRRRVLIIEDNVDGAASLRDVLELDDHQVSVATDGPEGLGMARELRPDAILCDIGLPGMDGYEVARALRADADLRGTFLIALTGYARPEDIVRAREAGFDRHLAKPPDLALLSDMLRRLEDRGAAAGTLTAESPTRARPSPAGG